MCGERYQLFIAIIMQSSIVKLDEWKCMAWRHSSASANDVSISIFIANNTVEPIHCYSADVKVISTPVINAFYALAATSQDCLFYFARLYTFRFFAACI